MFLLSDVVGPTAANQYVLEGNGEFDKKKWQKAVAEASAANPGIRVTLKGRLGFSSWVDTGNTPPVREVDGNSWEGFGPEGAPFLDDRLDPFEGPAAEVVLIHGKNPRVLFRTLHAITDGRGQLLWMKDIFRALNGKSLIGCDSTLYDYQVARRYKMGFRESFPDEHLSPTGRSEGNVRGVVWKRVKLEGKYPKIVSQICVLTAKEAWMHGDGLVRFGIPVDMRLHDRKLKSTANLVGGITIEVTPEMTASDVERNILKKIQNKEDLQVYRGLELIRYMPLWMIERGYYKLLNKRNQKGLYSVTGYISNVGYVSMSSFQTDKFKATGFFPIPPFNEILPFFMGLVSHGDPEKGIYQEMVLTMPKAFATKGRLDTLIHHLKEGLEQ